MLKSCIRKATAAARPVNRSGVAVISVAVQAGLPTNAGIEEPAVGVDRIVPGDAEDDRHHEEREGDRSDRDRDAEPARLREPALDLDHARSPPAIARPISSTVAVAGSNSPVSSPS